MYPAKSVKAVCTSDPDPPQESCKDQFLFLLEFYVKYIDSPRLSKLNEMFLTPTTVCFCFLNFEMDEEMQVTPVDPIFTPQATGCGDYEAFFSGRSVLFALDQQFVFEMFKDFKIDIRVVKKMPMDIRPDVLVGCGEVDLSILFAALRKELIDKVRYRNADVPDPVKTVEKEVPIYFEDSLVGCMKTFVRISTYGQTIITAFDPPDFERCSTSCFVFQGTDELCEDKVLDYKFKRFHPVECEIPSGLLREESCTKKPEDDCNICNPPKLPCGPCRVGSGAQIKGRTNQCPPPTPAQHPCCEAVNPNKSKTNQYFQSEPTKHTCCDGAQNKGRTSQAQAQQSCCQSGARDKGRSSQYPQQAPVQHSCCGGMGEPESTGGCGDPCAPSTRVIQTSRGPKEPCGKAVVLKVSGLVDPCDEDPCEEPTVTVTGEDEAVTPKEIEEDQEHDIFVLRIGKKGIVGAGEKSDIQLEMRTPKGPERRPPVRMETREIQTEKDKKGKKDGKKKK